MSRTYRKWLNWDWYAHGKFWTKEEMDKLSNEETLGWHGKYRIKKVKDSKCWNKPNKEFKQMKRRNERAKVKCAMAQEKDPPIFKKTDQWDWT